MSSLYEVRFFCISKRECIKGVKEEYKKHLEDIFQNERIKYNFEIKTFIIKDSQYNSINSTIQLYRRLHDDEVMSQNNNNKEDIEKDKEKEEKEKKKNQLNKKLYFCSLNKEKLYSQITFYDSIGKFLENSLYFVKYISNKKLNLGEWETRVIEISRCGYNMEQILKDIGYEESKKLDDLGFFYQYKYYPIICIYGVMQNNNHIYLQVRGYYTETNKDEILEKLKEREKQLSNLFIIK